MFNYYKSKEIYFMKKSKIILGIIIGILIIVIGLCITFHVLTKKENKVIAQIKQNLENKLTLEDMTYEYGSEITLQELNLDSNVKIYINNQELNNTYKFTEVGEYRLKAETSQIYKNFLNKKKIIIAEKEATIKVDDTKKPIIEGVTDKEITEGDTIDLKQGIMARDEIDGDLEIIIEGEVDTNKVGEYEIKVKATDKNNNTTETIYKVKVNAKSEEVSENTTTQSNQNTQSGTNKSNNGTTNKSTDSNTSNTNNKTTANNNANNQTTKSTSGKTKSSDEPKTYTGETDGNKYYFQDRGENGNYGEKFSW